MANYSLVIDSRFRPFEYSELMAPLLQATQAHQVLEDAYGEIEKEASALDRKTEGSEKLNRIYKKYISDLQNASDVLSKSGLSLDSRRSVLNLRSRYAKELVPIIESIQKRNDVEKMQQEILLKDPTHLFDRMASEVSLDEFYDNPQLDLLSQNYSGELIRTQSAQAFANLQKTLTEEGKLEKILPFQYKQKLTSGFSLETVLGELAADPNAPRDKRTKAQQLINETVDNILKSTGIPDWSSINGDTTHPTYQKARRWALQGAFSGIGTTTYATYTDQFGANSALENQRHINRIKEDNNATANELKKIGAKGAEDRKTLREKGRIISSANPSNGNGQGLISARYGTRPLSSFKGDNLSQREKDFIKYYNLGYFARTGNGMLTLSVRGQKEARKQVTHPGSISPTIGLQVSSGSRGSSAFGQFLNSLGIGYAAQRGGEHSQRVITNLYNKTTAFTDSKRAGEYYRDINPTSFDGLAAILHGRSRSNKLPTIDLKRNSDTTVTAVDGSSWDIQNIQAKNIMNAMLVSSPAGNYFEITYSKKPGESVPKRVRVPVSAINTQVDKLMKGSRNEIKGYSNMAKEGKQYITINGVRMSLDDAATVSINNALDNGFNTLNLYQVDDTKNKVTPGEYFNVYDALFSESE